MNLIKVIEISFLLKFTVTLLYIAFSEATFKASSEISIAETFTAGRFFASAIAIHPEPVPISNKVLGFLLQFAIIQSTNSSVSGRGMSVAGVTLKGSP